MGTLHSCRAKVIASTGQLQGQGTQLQAQSTPTPPGSPPHLPRTQANRTLPPVSKCKAPLPQNSAAFALVWAQIWAPPPLDS